MNLCYHLVFQSRAEVAHSGGVTKPAAFASLTKPTTEPPFSASGKQVRIDVDSGEDWSSDDEVFDGKGVRMAQRWEMERMAAAVAKRAQWRKKTKNAKRAESEAQRKLFLKVPRQSYTNSPRAQPTRGLLSTMFYPPPEIFSDDNPYRPGMSNDIPVQGPRESAPLNFGNPALKSAAAQPVVVDVTAQALPIFPQSAPVYSPNGTRSPLRLKGRQLELFGGRVGR